MSLQFIMGPSGSGKSHYLYQKVTEESITHPDKNYFVIVPDQFTMQTQKDFVMASPKKGIMNVDVLSFNRLAYRIFEETGTHQKTVLDDVGKSLILRKIANRYESELKVLGGNLKKSGFIAQMKSVISEFTQYDIQEADIDQMLCEVDRNTNFYHKVQDIRTIYKGFQEYLSGKYITGEEILDLLCLSVPKSKLLKDSVIVLDGFTGFTPVQNKLLKQLLQVCEKMMVTVTVSEHKSTDMMYALSDKMLHALGRIADECHVVIENPIRMAQPVYRFRENEVLGFLESNLFRYTKKQYTKKQDKLQIYYAKQPAEEMDFVAQQIRKMVREDGLRYRDIAVIAGDVGSYGNYVEKSFMTYEIPCFMDRKRSILLNSFVEYLRSLLAMAEQNFDYESVFRYLRTNLTEFTSDEVDALENYCIALGIRGYKKWNEMWIRRAGNMVEADLATINAIRARFVSGLEEVMSVLKKRSKTVKEVTVALHQYLYENELQLKVKQCAEAFAYEGELALEKEYAQIYRIVMELFDRFAELLGDEKISLKEYCELLDAGLEAAKVGIIPPSSDQVVIGDIERTRIKDVKVLFFVGVNDCYIPGNAGNGGLLSERDRETFEKYNITLAPSAKERAFLQKFYLYLILTKPSEKVILTYSKLNPGGKPQRPAYLVADLVNMYPGLRVQTTECTPVESEFTPASGLLFLAHGLRERGNGLSPVWQELYSWYQKHPEWARQMEQVLEAGFYCKPEALLTKESLESLYGTTLLNSVSRLEKFSECAFAHFLSYGLRLQERDEYQFRSLDLGNLMHDAMERYAKKLDQAHLLWTEVSEEATKQLIEECVEESIVDYGNTILYSSARNEYMITRLKGMMSRTVWALTKQLEKGDFVPEEFEFPYLSDSISLGQEHQMRVRGKIDRIDVCEQEDKRFVKVIDYKTSNREFDFAGLYYGLQMQLAVYMNAVLQKERREHPDKQIVPAGLFYFCMQNPLISRSETAGSTEEGLLRTMRPAGVLNVSEEVIGHMDRTFENGSTVVPVTKNKKSGYRAADNLLTTEDFELISEFVEHKMTQIGAEIMSGEISASPYKQGDDTGCMFCPYSGVCGFDEKIPGYAYRKLEKVKAKEALEMMRKEAETWD